AQDHLYTLVERSGAGARYQVIGALRDVIFAPDDRSRLLRLIADRDIRIVSSTVTEKGYCHDPASGRLNPGHPDIIHDLANADALIRDTAAALGVLDDAPVQCEPFGQWVIEDSFATERPAWELAGAELVADVTPYEKMNVRLLNGRYSMLPYLGSLGGDAHVF